MARRPAVAGKTPTGHTPDPPAWSTSAPPLTPGSGASAAQGLMHCPDRQHELSSTCT